MALRRRTAVAGAAVPGVPGQNGISSSRSSNLPAGLAPPDGRLFPDEDEDEDDGDDNLGGGAGRSSMSAPMSPPPMPPRAPSIFMRSATTPLGRRAPAAAAAGGNVALQAAPGQWPGPSPGTNSPLDCSCPGSAYRIAFGPRAGQKVFTVQGTIPRDTAFTQTRCADAQGFSVRAAVRCGAHARPHATSSLIASRRPGLR